MIITERNKELVNLYKKIKKTDNFLISTQPQNFSIKTLRETKNIMRKEKCKFYIKDIEQLSSNIIPLHLGIVLNKSKSNVHAEDQTGMFKIIFNDDSFILVSTWLQGYKLEIQRLAVGEKETWYKFHKELDTIKTKINFPGNGIFNAAMFLIAGHRKLVYSKLKKNSFYYGKVIHQNKKELESEIDYFFENPKEFLKYGSPGVRKIMLIGEPGTGKSSICYNIARAYSDKMNIAYVNSPEPLIRHSKILSESDVPGIIIVEDCENILQDADSNMLNWLSGLHQKRHQKGLLILFTTNHPTRIDDRILKRPGRVDSTYEIGALTKDEAAICAQIYFGKRVIKDHSNGWGKIFNNLTGSQIKELAHISKMKAASERAVLNEDFIKKMIKEMRDHYDTIRKYSDKKSKVLLKNRQTQIGYNQTKNTDWELDELFRD